MIHADNSGGILLGTPPQSGFTSSGLDNNVPDGCGTPSDADIHPNDNTSHYDIDNASYNHMAENSAYDNTLNDNTLPWPEDDGDQDAPSKFCSFVAWARVCGC